MCTRQTQNKNLFKSLDASAKSSQFASVVCFLMGFTWSFRIPHTGTLTWQVKSLSFMRFEHTCSRNLKRVPLSPAMSKWEQSLQMLLSCLQPGIVFSTLKAFFACFFLYRLSWQRFSLCLRTFGFRCFVFLYWPAFSIVKYPNAPCMEYLPTFTPKMAQM